MKSGPKTYGFASKKDESTISGNVNLTDVGSQKVEREPVDWSVSIESPPEEPLSLENLKVPMEVESLELTVEDLIDFTVMKSSHSIN